jgi:2-succinyl-6-hydroxy-2,4-cyclohexadiene-1-carboxylate synthase
VLVVDDATPAPIDAGAGALTVHRRGTGRRMVLVHGFTQTAAVWSELDPWLDGVEVLAVDAPGHGGSTHVVCDLDEGAALLGRAGGRAAYVGYSMGGRLALHLALAEPGLVDALVLVGASPGIEDAADRAARRADDERRAQRLESIGVDAFLEEWLRLPLFATLPAERARIEDRRVNTVTGLASSLRLAGAGAQRPLWDELSRLTMPVLYIAGEHDVVYRSMGERVVAAIGAHAVLEIVPGAGHAAHLERPEVVGPLVRRFVDASPAHRAAGG